MTFRHRNAVNQLEDFSKAQHEPHHTPTLFEFGATGTKFFCPKNYCDVALMIAMHKKLSTPKADIGNCGLFLCGKCIAHAILGVQVAGIKSVIARVLHASQCTHARPPSIRQIYHGCALDALA
eukprot:5081079-Amphidinium_carterae.1